MAQYLKAWRRYSSRVQNQTGKSSTRVLDCRKQLLQKELECANTASYFKNLRGQSCGGFQSLCVRRETKCLFLQSWKRARNLTMPRREYAPLRKSNLRPSDSKACDYLVRQSFLLPWGIRWWSSSVKTWKNSWQSLDWPISHPSHKKSSDWHSGRHFRWQESRLWSTIRLCPAKTKDWEQNTRTSHRVAQEWKVRLDPLSKTLNWRRCLCNYKLAIHGVVPNWIVRVWRQERVFKLRKIQCKLRLWSKISQWSCCHAH